MNVLDPRSIIAMACITCALMAVVLFVMQRNYPAHIKGLGLWMTAAALWSFSAVLLANRTSGLPPFLVVFLPNLGIVLATLLYYAGYRTFIGLRMRWGPWFSLLALFTLSFIWWTFIDPNYPPRMMIFGVTCLSLYGATFGVMLRHGSKRLPVRMAEFFLLLQISAILWRLLTLTADMTVDGLLEKTLVQSVYLGSFVISMFFLTISAVLMAADRLTVELEKLARHDTMTELPNRRCLFEHMEAEVARTRRSGRGPALLMFDLDYFKHINDTHGHQHGDKVLRHFAQTLQAQLRKTDILGRYGGEEFMAMLPETDTSTALQITERIHQATNDGHPMACTVSVGLATWHGPEDTLDTLIARADSAAYQAKAQGRNRTCSA